MFGIFLQPVVIPSKLFFHLFLVICAPCWSIWISFWSFWVFSQWFATFHRHFHFLTAILHQFVVILHLVLIILCFFLVILSLFLCSDWTDVFPSRWYVTTMLCELVDRRKRVIVLTLLEETRSSCASVSSGSSFPSNALTCLSNTGTVNTYTPAGFESWTLFPQIRPTAVLSFCVKWKIMQK